MSTGIQAPRGTKDLYGREVVAWQKLEATIRELCNDFGIGEMRTPIFEHTELFVRGVGDTTDVVQKEMYTFPDRGGRSLTLKPEATAGLVRAYIERNVYAGIMPFKVWCATPVFRYEKPQAGRMRQFHQFDVEYMGSYHPSTDAELITVGYELIRRLGIPNVKLYINSLGCKDCHEKHYKLMMEFLNEHKESLCPTCKERMGRNPLRVLDCKEQGCQDIVKNAPTPLDILDEECAEHFEGVKAYLTAMGIEFEVDSHIVRGLDYYTRTVFEFVSTDIGAQSTICGGGRYDNMMEECGGPPTGCIGFGLGMERILMALDNTGMGFDTDVKPDIYIAAIGDKGHLKAHELCLKLRQKDIYAEGDIMGRSVKAQMKHADRLKARYSMVIGDDELGKNSAVVRNMDNGEQTEVAFSELEGFLRDK